jgi:hypothetical protein
MGREIKSQNVKCKNDPIRELGGSRIGNQKSKCKEQNYSAKI